MRMLRISDVMIMTGFHSRDSIYRLINEGKFPKQRKLVEGGRASGWVAGEIMDYMKKRMS